MKSLTLNEDAVMAIKTLRFIENYVKETDAHLGISGYSLAQFIELEKIDTEDFCNYLFRNKEYEAYVSTMISLYNRTGYFNVKQMKEVIDVYPEGFANLAHTYRSELFVNFIDEIYEHTIFQKNNAEEINYLPRHLNGNKELIGKLAVRNHYYRHFLNAKLDSQIFKDCLKEAPELLRYENAEITGNISLMREFCAANPECAVYARSPITKNAGVLESDSEGQKKDKVNLWLRSTKEVKLFKAKGVMPVAPAAKAQRKSTYKI